MMQLRTWWRRNGVVFAVSLCVWGTAIPTVLSQPKEQSPLRKVADIPLPGKAVRFDYPSLDASHGRLYIAHMNADHAALSSLTTAPPVMLGCLAAEAVPLTSDQRLPHLRPAA